MSVSFGKGKIREIKWNLNNNNNIMYIKFITNDNRKSSLIGKYNNNNNNNKCDNIILKYDEYINGYRIVYNISNNINGISFNTNLNNIYSCGILNNNNIKYDYDSLMIYKFNQYLSGFYYDDTNNNINKLSFKFNKLSNETKLLHKRRLNTIYFDRVMDVSKPLSITKPNTKKFESKKIIIKIDKKCSKYNEIDGNKNHNELFNELLNQESKCLSHINTNFGDNGDGTYQTKNDYFVFAKLASQDGCLDQNTINHQAFCITSVEYSPLMELYGDAQCNDHNNSAYVFIIYIIYIYICLI